MAHRDGLRVSYDRPQPPRLALQGRSLPKIIGQVRALRGLWAAEEQRLDEDDLEAFERVERLEQQLAADLEAREAAATQAEKDALVAQIGDRKARLRQLVHDLRAQSHDIERLREQQAELNVAARQQELWEARLELGFTRQNDTETGVEHVFDQEEQEEEFIFASLPSKAQQEAAHKVEHDGSAAGAAHGRAAPLDTVPQSPALDSDAYAEKLRRVQIFSQERNSSPVKHAPVAHGEQPVEPSTRGWASRAASKAYEMAQEKAVLQRQLQQLKEHVRLLTKAKSEAMEPKCPVPITNAIAAAKEKVGDLDDENEYSKGFKLFHAPSHALLLTELRRKTWAYKMKVAVECRLRLFVILKGVLNSILMQEMEPPEPIFMQPRKPDADKTDGKQAQSEQAVEEPKGWYDEIAGPAFDYDYASIDRMGHPGVVGFTVMTKAALQPLRDQRRAAAQLKWEEEEHLHQVMEAADTEYSAQQTILERELEQMRFAKERISQGVKTAHDLDSQIQVNEEVLQVLKQQRDEAEVSLTRVLRQQLRVVMIVWRAYTCAARPEAHERSTTHKHVKRLIQSQEFPKYLMEQRERPQCKRTLASLAQEVRELGGIGGDEITEIQPWIGACIAPASFKGEVDGKGERFCEGLQLEHVYGYRGTDCRSNVFHMRTGEAVYPAGSFGIVHNIVPGPDTMHRQTWFKNWHKGQITCLTLHPDGATVATAECAGNVHEVPRIYIWRVVNGECSLVGTCNDPLNEKVGLLEGVISCLAFSKGGRYLVAIGDRWPNQSLVVYEWDTDDCGAIVKHDLGRQKALSLAVNPYTDTIVVTGDRFINLMHSATNRKEEYRQVAGHLRWDLTHEDVLSLGAQAAAHADSASSHVYSASPGKDRAQSLFQHDMASGKALKGDKKDIFGTIPEQDESGRDVRLMSESGFNRLRGLIKEHVKFARDAIDSKLPVSAIAECKCGLRACEHLLDIVDRGLVRDYGAAVVDSIGLRQALVQLQNHLNVLLLEAMDTMEKHQATYSRTYGVDNLLQESFADMHRTFAHLLDGSRPFLQESLRRAEAGLNELINIDKSRQLCVESCNIQNRLGAGYWKINKNSPVMHTPRLQAVFCLGFTGHYTFVTGTEDGSLYFWDGSELVGAVPVHTDAIIDMAVDLNGFESRGSFHVVTAGYDGTVRLSSCERFEQGLRDQFYSGIVLHQLQTVVLPLSILTGQPSPAVSISNIIGLDKFSGLPCVDWIDKPCRYARFTTNGVQFSAEEIPTSKHSLLIGTADNCLFRVCFGDRESQATSSVPDPAFFPIVQAHAGSGVNCVSAHPKQSNLIFSGGEDGIARMWDVPKRELQKWYFAKDAITCSDFSATGHIIAVGFAGGGFMIFDSATLLPKSQVVREFEVLFTPHQDSNPLTCTTTCGPMSQSEKDLKKKWERLREKRDYLVKKSKGQQNIPADALPEWESWVAEIQVIEQKLRLKQQKLFKGSFLAPDDMTLLSRRRNLLEELNLSALSGKTLSKEHSKLLIVETIKEREQQRALISDVDYQLNTDTVTVKFASPFSRGSQKRAVTIQSIQDAVRHLKRKTAVVKFSPDTKYLAVAGLDKMVYVHQVSSLGQVATKISGHTGPVRSIDWMNDSMHFQTNTDTHQLRFWKLHKPERTPMYAEELRAKELEEHLSCATWTCSMGWPVLGILTTENMPPRSNIPVHSAFTYAGSFIIFGDPAGGITLARFPCPSLERLRKRYGGHCSPIKALQFIDNCNRVASCSVEDSSIVQWRMAQEVQVPEVKKVEKVPEVVLHGDVSAASADLCAICRNVNCTDSTHEVAEKSKALRKSVSAGGGYRGDRDEAHEDDGIPQLPWESTMFEAIGWSGGHEAPMPWEEIELDHVFGYQGSDRKCNARILRTDEVIYASGCIVIVSNNYTRQQRHFTRHQSAIVSFAVHPDNSTICSLNNGEQPSILIWDSITMEVSHNLCHLFTTGFISVSFGGHRGEMLFVIGNDDLHTMKVLDWKAETELISKYTQGDAVTAVVYNHYVIDEGGFVPNIATVGEGKIFFWDIRYLKAGDTWKLSKRMSDFKGKPNTSMGCGAFLGPITLCSGSYDGFLYMWELEKLVLRIKVHSGPIFDIKVNAHQKSFITCSSDGTIKIFTTVPGGDFTEICESFAVSAIIVHVSVMDDSREPLGYVMLKPDESLKDVRTLFQTSGSSDVYIDRRIRRMMEGKQTFLFVTDRGKNLVREKNEEFTLAKDLYSEVCIVLGQDRIDMMIDFESVNDIDLLVTKPEGIIDQCEVRMSGFERNHAEIRSIDWVRGSIVFGTQKNVLYAIDSLKGRRSPEQITDALCNTNIRSLCPHPSLPWFYTASSDGVLQMWDQATKKCTQTKEFDFSVRVMDISPDGHHLVVATSTGCLVLNSLNLEENHWIHYRPHRVTDIFAVKFSFNGQYLAIGTSEGRIDFFDVHGRTHLTTWVSERINMSLDAGGLEIDFSDGVLLCKLIEIVLATFADGRSITELSAYADVVDRPPSVNAWKNRPKSYAQKISLMEEGLQLVALASTEALHSYETHAAQLDDPSYKPWISKDIKDASKQLIVHRMRIVRAGKDKFRARDLIGKDKPVDRTSLFEFLRFLKAMDPQILQEQTENVHTHRELKTELSNYSSKEEAAQREAAKARSQMDETARRLKFAERSKSILLMQSLELDFQMQSRAVKHVEERLSEIKVSREKAQAKYEMLVYRMDRAKEEVFCFLGTGTGPKPHTKPITHIDWSIDGTVVKSVSLAAGELIFWYSDGFQQVWPESCAGQDWATQKSPFSWAVKGLIHFECMDKQHYTRLDRGPIRSESNHLLSIGDRSGRVLLTAYPFPYVHVDVDLHFGDAFVSEIGFKRVTVEIESKLISEIADLLSALKQRITIVKSTAPTTFTVRIGPPIGSDDKRPAFQLSVEALCSMECGKMRSYTLLKHCKAVKGAAISSCVGHTSPILSAVFDGNGQTLLSVGESDRMICIWRILRPEDRNKGRRIHQSVKSRLEHRISQALIFLRLGDGKRIEKALIDFLYEWDVAKSGIPPEKIDPVIRMVEEYRAADIRVDLERRGISMVGLTERDELAARLCTAMTTPETMTVAEIRAELAHAKVPSADVFERAQLVALLLQARQEGTEFPRPIPFAFQRIAPTHEVIIARAHARWEAGRGGVKKTRSLKDLERDVLEILDAVYSLDLHEAGELGVRQILVGIMALIQSNRLEIAAACARDKLYDDSSRKGMDINFISRKDPRDVDWLVAGAPPSTDPASLRKGGYLYDLAIKSSRGDLLPGSWYTFQEIPGRYFQYVRYNERGEFEDRMHEHSASSPSAREREPTRVSGLKTIRWGSRFYAKVVMDNTIKSQNLPLQWKQDSQKPQSTAYLYQVPVGIPRLYARRLPSATQIEDFFGSLDKARIGLVDMESFEEAIFKERYHSEVLGLPVQSEQDASILKELVFSRSLLAGQGHSDEDIGSKSRIQQSDLFDFLLPNINVLGHLVFKVRIGKLSGLIRIGLVDVFRIPRGISLDADWIWPGFPTWHLDSLGGLYQFGREVCRATTGLKENDVVVADLDQNLGVLRFFKEGSPDPIGMLADVYGVVSCALQFTDLDDEAELLPF